MKRFVLASACLWALALSVAAAPPALEIPAEVKPVQGYARVNPKTDAVSVTYVSLDGLFPFPSEELKDPRRFVLPVNGVKDGRYRYVAVAASATGEQAVAEFAVVVGAPAPPPVPPVPPGPQPNPDPKPAPVQVDAVWVVVVEDGARTVDVAKALNDPFWATLKPKHEFRFYQSDAKVAVDNGYTDTGKSVGYPAVLVLDAKDGTVLRKFKLDGIDAVKQAVKEVTK